MKDKDCETFTLNHEKAQELKLDDMHPATIDDLIQAIVEAEKLALEKGIETNAVFLNKKYDFCKDVYVGSFWGDSVRHVYPMILGKQLLTCDLPQKYTFALGKNPHKTYVEKLEEENALLKRYVKLIGSEDNEQLVFKGVSTKHNKEDFERIKSILYERIK